MSLIPLRRNKQEWDHDNHPYSFDNPNIYMRPATEDDVDNMYSWEMESIDKSLQEDPKKYKLSLAKRILRAAHSHDMDTDGWDTINDYIKNHKESVVQEGFVDKNIKYTLAGIKIPKLGPVDEKCLMDHKSEYARLKKSGYIDLHYDNFQRLFNDKADELYDALDNLFQHIGYVKDFNIYNKYRLLLCKLFDLPTNHVIGLEGYLSKSDMGILRLKDEEDKVGTPLKPEDVLYHTSKHKGITELQPSFVSRKGEDPFDIGKNILSIEALYTTPRVYVGLNQPVGRMGGSGGSNTRIYKIIGFKGYVKEDKELRGGAARFIETRSPVKVQDVTEEYLSKHIKEASTIQEGFFEVGFGNLRKTVADKLGKFVTVTNVQNPTGKEAKFVIKSNEHPEDYVNVIAMGNGVKAYGYKDSERVSIFNNASLSAAIQKLIDSVCDLFDIQKPINESYTERKNFIMKEQITKILEAYNSGVLTQEEASTKIEAIQEQVVTESAVNTTDDLRVKQDKIMESFKMGIINATEGMRLIERVMMEADYIAEEEDTAYEGDDDNEPEDITPEDTDGDTVDSDDTNIDALADYINSLSDDEKTALMSKLSGSDEPTDDDANGNEEVPTDDDASAGEPTTEETVDPASVSDASLNDANASLDDMEV
jgi:hypothetical protein